MTNGPSSLTGRLESLVAPEVRALGYELLELEYQPRSNHGGAVLRLFIENPNGAPISFDDCAAVDRGLDPLLEGDVFGALLADTFTLEVSSPGVDRPLKKPSDFIRFAGQRVQIKTFRPLTTDEMGNSKYFEHHQKQKNFFGTLQGYSGDSVELETDGEKFRIPYALITKAHLDIVSHLETNDKQE